MCSRCSPRRVGTSRVIGAGPNSLRRPGKLGSQAIERDLKVLGKAAGDLHQFLGDWMSEFQLTGVEPLPSNAQSLGKSRISAIEGVPDNRMAVRGHVNADLMRSTRL